ncbi:hypothetical protein GOP47_0008596 [Adiantum capillus-veneris]|uniref:Tyrosinase copper-binding domain-containing protein n=1 Tax=Adiantum capillus-veneris TaxID=13818 RepID=A0A9D4UYP8_ADICA|nr:hypothetical protein GOP47_0008596 [Adiantum capillus-veneris]
MLKGASSGSVPCSPGNIDPILPPDLTQCSPAFAVSVAGPPVNLTFNCCLPLPKKKVKNFTFKKGRKRVKKVRRAAHHVDAAYIEKYNKAYELMKALPADDPRSFAQQADVHCAFCNGAYKQVGAENVTLQIHFSWLFLPWHRWYLYFHERILASLLGDPEFALVYWNWDNQIDGNMMPAFFAKNNTPVYDEKRNPAVQPPAIVRLAVLSTYNTTAEIINDNLNQMYQSVVTASTPELFTGGAYRVGTDLANSTVLNSPLGGSFEDGVHNAIHFWTGSPTFPLLQDMGVFSTASRDPIFYAHHGNVDRLWEVWKHDMPGGQRYDHTDPDFLEAEFVFYDENANLVKVKAKDALDNERLDITYTKVYADQLWINYSPNATTTTPSPTLDLPTIGLASDTSDSITLGKRLSAWVTQPSFKDLKNLKVLTIQGLEITREFFTQILVFVNLPNADINTKTNTAEYVGTFNIVPTFSKKKHLKTNVKFEIGDNIKRIGLQDEAKVIITIVVGTYEDQEADVTIKGMTIKYD